MAEKQRQVRGLIVPLQGVSLVLPDSTILQVLTTVQPIPYENSPKWLLGSLDWQKRKLPVLAFEIAGRLAVSLKTQAGEHFLVMKSINHIEKMPFYALQISGVPHPVDFSEAGISLVENTSINSPLILSQILVEGEIASIPNLDAIEQILMSQYDIFARENAV